jgi:hypothetical protein
MKKNKVKRSLIPHGGEDRVYTPDELANRIVKYFRPQIMDDDRMLEPCVGRGAFMRAFKNNGIKTRNVFGLEIENGSDFFDFHDRVDWVMTNPPWGKTRLFAQHAYEVADNVVFLVTLIHFTGLKTRLRDMHAAGFRMKEIVLVPTPPKPWPQSGFQLGAIHFQRTNGRTKWSNLP